MGHVLSRQERNRRRSMGWEPPSMGGESPGPAPPVLPAVSELRLVLLGGSAAGKRAAGNAILGREEFGRQASTLTSTEIQHSESRQGEVAGRRVTVVNTPDWFCSGLSEKDMRQDVGLCIHLSAPGPHAFLLVVPVELSEGEGKRMLEKMEDIFGEGCWRHTLILFTHAEGLGERSVEDLLQTGSQELQQLVEKCGNRYHLLNIRDRPDDTDVTQLLGKIVEMVSGNRHTFYSSETYEEAERQLRELQRRMQREREVEESKLREEKERRLKEEREKREELEKNIQDNLRRREGEIKQHEGQIRHLNERMTELEKGLKEERDEEKRRELERELKRESALREEMEGKLNSVKEKRERERREMEERHREEMEEMRESFEREVRAEAETNLMKIILPQLQRNISISKEKMEAEFNRQMEEKNREMERLRQQLKERESELEDGREKNREMERLRQQLEEKEAEIEDDVEAIQRLGRDLLIAADPEPI